MWNKKLKEFVGKPQRNIKEARKIITADINNHIEAIAQSLAEKNHPVYAEFYVALKPHGGIQDLDVVEYTLTKTTPTSVFHPDCKVK